MKKPAIVAPGGSLEKALIALIMCCSAVYVGATVQFKKICEQPGIK